MESQKEKKEQEGQTRFLKEEKKNLEKNKRITFCMIKTPRLTIK